MTTQRHVTPLMAMIATVLIVIVLAVTRFEITDARLSRAAAIAGAVLVLWLLEVVPLYATTLLLWAAILLWMRPLDPVAFSMDRTLAHLANPIMAVFFGGFVLSAAGTKYGIDRYIAAGLVGLSRGHRRRLLLGIMVGTATLSMWMSNIAAASMMIATLKPLFDGEADQRPSGFRTALLLGVAFAADFGGMGTPIGTGPNLIAIGAVASQRTITFAQWMLFGVPIAFVMISITYGLLVSLHGVRGRIHNRNYDTPALTLRGWLVVAIFCLAAGGWMFEPFLGIPAATVALVVAAALFATGLLDRTDLGRVEWDTLLLVAGGLTFGYLVEASGLAVAAASHVRWQVLNPSIALLGMMLACAILSAIASNTAASAMIIPMTLAIQSRPSTAVLVALAASMGVPFVISTPPNSLAYGQGGLHSRDLLWPGMILMLVGCTLLLLAGPIALRWAGFQ